MDVKELNKSQLILLAILLSFITSIATGITTVSLMQQAPKAVTVPINRVVRETVEKIVPGVSETQTVVVKEEDLVVDAIAKNQPVSFSITKEAPGSDGKIIEISAGRGFTVSKDGTIAADATLVSNGGTYFVSNGTGKFRADFVSTKEGGFSFLKIGAPIDPQNKVSVITPSFGDIGKIKIGQKIIVFGNSISSFIFDGNKDVKISNNKTNAGGLVLDLDGEVLGMVLSGEQNSFVPIAQIIRALK